MSLPAAWFDFSFILFIRLFVFLSSLFYRQRPRSLGEKSNTHLMLDTITANARCALWELVRVVTPGYARRRITYIGGVLYPVDDHLCVLWKIILFKLRSGLAFEFV